MIKKIYFILIILSLLLTHCGDKDLFIEMGPSYNSGSSVYEFSGEWGEDLSSSKLGAFKKPYGIYIKKIGNKEAVYVVDSGNNRIERFDTSGNIWAWLSGGSIGGEDKTAGKFEMPINIFVDKSNNMFIADMYNGRVQKFDSDGNVKFLIGDYNTNILIQPVGVTCDSGGNIYVVDKIRNHIKKFSSAGSYISTFGLFNNSSDIYIFNDEIYVSDTGNHCIVKYDIFGNKKATIGSFGYKIDELNAPKGIYVDKNYIYVIDGNYVKIFNKDGNFFTYIGGGTGESKGLFNEPSDVAADELGNLYITDTENNRVTVFKKR
jgi:sugar lactone lactonase YvrE